MCSVPAALTEDSISHPVCSSTSDLSRKEYSPAHGASATMLHHHHLPSLARSLRLGNQPRCVAYTLFLHDTVSLQCYSCRNIPLLRPTTKPLPALPAHTLPSAHRPTLPSHPTTARNIPTRPLRLPRPILRQPPWRSILSHMKYRTRTVKGTSS